MKIEPLLRKGYFPKELPPPFTTKYFSENFYSIDKSWNDTKSRLGRTNPKLLEKYEKKTSVCVLYSLPKRNFTRRNIEIPNPFHHSILCKTICDHWNEIDAFCKKSVISMSRPVINEKGTRAAIPLKTFDIFKQECLMASYDKMYELKTDISWFYPTLYTHTIAWALHEKKVAKKNKSLDLLGNKLDYDIRNCKNGQTTGIPIGPDTSHIIAEIVSCGIDILLLKELGSIKGYRFYDDVYFYFSSREEAEKGLKTLQYILTDFQLSINEEKTGITKFPSTFDENWVIQISSYKFRNNIKKEKIVRAREQRTDIERYFRLALYCANEYPEDAVLEYAIKKVKNVPIMDENWNLFESLVLKAALLNPLLLIDIILLLIAYNRLVNIDKICNVVEEIIKNHAPMAHSFEISWALWLAKTFNIKIKKSMSDNIFKSNDVIPILIALDLKSNNLIESTSDLTTIIESIINDDSLFEEKWLLIYESIIHEWLPPITPNPLETNEYFKILKDHNVKFYDETIKAEKFIIKGLKAKLPQVEPQAEIYIEVIPPVEESIEEGPLVEEYSEEDYSSYY
jgi:hypothetical protein